MKFYKIVITKEHHREKWVEVDGEQKKVKSILVGITQSTNSIYLSEARAKKANNGKMVSNAFLRKNKKTENIGKHKWGVDEIFYLTCKVQEVEISTDNIIKFEHSGNMLVAEDGGAFIVYAEKDLEK